MGNNQQSLQKKIDIKKPTCKRRIVYKVGNKIFQPLLYWFPYAVWRGVLRLIRNWKLQNLTNTFHT